MELGGTNFCNYQLAKCFYHIGKYEYASEYFEYLGDYKDSETLVKQIKLTEIKNADLYDWVYLGDWDSQNYIYSGENLDAWRVIAKEGDRVLLLQSGYYGGIEYSSDCNIIGVHSRHPQLYRCQNRFAG